MFEEIEVKKVERRKDKTTLEHICRNCKLFNTKENTCGVTVIKDGEYYELQVLPNNRCVWEQWDIEIQQVREWVDTEKGKAFIEAPVNTPVH